MDDHTARCLLEQANRQSYLMAGMLNIMAVMAKTQVSQSSSHTIESRNQIRNKIDHIVKESGT